MNNKNYELGSQSYIPRNGPDFNLINKYKIYTLWFEYCRDAKNIYYLSKRYVPS